MVAVKATDIKQNFKSICDRVFQGEAMIVSRPRNENVVIISENEYTELQKARRNAEYIQKIDRGFSQIESGKGHIHELIEE